MTKKAAHPHVEKATRYAKDVVAGKLVACKWRRLACQRFLNDLKRAKSKAYPFKFDPEKAEKACRFAELMPHVKGKWAKPDEAGVTQRIRLEPFQCFRRANLYGWVEKATGRRRFRVAYDERPRKNAKSTDAAIDGLYFFAADGEMGAEVYSGATSEKQAWEVFRPAKQMAERTDEFREHYGVEVNAKSLTILATGARFEPIIGKPGDGASPSEAIVDEYHEHQDSTLYDTMQTGMGAREQPLLNVITTAGEDLGGPCFAMNERVRKMLEGTQEDERLWGVIDTIDEAVDWTSEEALRMANPNFGVSVDAEFLREQQKAAINDARLQNTFKTKHLNVWCSARSPWMNMEWWNRCADASLDPAQFLGEPVALGGDLSSRLDLADTCRVFRRDPGDGGKPHFYAFSRHYCPRAMVEDATRRHYQKWEHEGHLTATEGNDIDYGVMAQDALGDIVGHAFTAIWMDPWNQRALTDKMRAGVGDMTGIGDGEAVVVEVPQNVANLSDVMKDLEAAVASGRFHHTGDPVLAWGVSNVTVRPDAKDNIFPRKDRPENKIDPAVALILAFKGAQHMAPADSGFFAESV